MDNIALTSDNFVDKIIHEGEVTYTVTGPANPTTPNLRLESIPNPTGQKCLTAASWSVDGSNYYDQQAATYYYLNAFNPNVLSFNAMVGTDLDNIYFSMRNGLVDVDTFVAIDQTVTIKYALYAIE